MTTSTLSDDSRSALKYATHGLVLFVWFGAGCVLALTQLFGTHALADSVNYWLWFAGLVALTTFLIRFTKSAVAVLAIHAAVALALNLIPTAMPFGLLRAGYDLLLAH